MPGNGTGIINTSEGLCDADGPIVGRWKAKTTMKSVFDGTSNTILAGELHIPNGGLNLTPFNGPIYNGQELVAHSRIGGPGVPLLTANDEPGALYGFGSAHPGQTNFVFADGSTTAINNLVDTIVLGKFCHRADGEINSKY